MKKLNLNPGPSQISPEVKQDIIDFANYEIGSMSHRSKEFSELSKKLHDNLRELFSIPEDYTIFYTSSATDSMEILIRNFVISRVHHFVNGAFSSKLYKTSLDLNKDVTKEELAWGEGDFSLETPQDAELICVTNNETSTGVRLKDSFLENLKEKNKDKLIAVDITSTAGCVFNNISLADIWFFSIQKGFGLPAGLGFLIVNNKALEKVKQVKKLGLDTGSVHSIENMLKKMDKYQTNETPNIFAIYLLANQLERMNKITSKSIENDTLEKYDFIDSEIKKRPYLSPYVENDEIRSKSVYVVNCDIERQQKIKAILKENNVIIGGGYGKLKETTFRIANFPAISLDDLKRNFELIKR